MWSMRSKKIVEALNKHISVIKYILKIQLQYKQEVGYMERNVLVDKSLFFFSIVIPEMRSNF